MQCLFHRPSRRIETMISLVPYEESSDSSDESEEKEVEEKKQKEESVVLLFIELYYVGWIASARE